MSGPVTTGALIRAYADKTGIAEAECLQIVAKSASIRAMAHKYGKRFVLKGGTLLYHVYKSRRASYKDADLAEKGGHYEDPDELGRVLTITEGTFQLRGNAGRWGWGEDLIEGLEIPVDLGIKVALPRYKRLKITVSLRQSEQLDPPKEPLFYTDEMLADESTFEVSGLTLNELAAEKIIGWALRGEPKHYADLGLIGRDHVSHIDADKVEDFTRRKIASERQMEATRSFYVAKGVRGPADLAKHFRSPALAGRLHQRNWENVLGADLAFMAEEEEEAEPFTDVQNVKKVVESVWGPVLDRLVRGSPSPSQ